jgi:pimeloyl-ACP methyl ester carboxylesterase
MPLASINGTEIHYDEHGAGPAVMLIHGLGSSGADWAFQLPALRPHFRLIVPDLRGAGLSGKPAGPFSIQQFADDLWALLAHLGIQQVDLVGFSLGGAVALEMALQQPSQVARVVTINALPSYRIDQWAKWWQAHAQLWMVRWLGLPRTARLIGARLFPEPHQAAMRRRVEEVVGANARRPYLDTVRALMRWCAADRLDQLQSRLLMLSAEHDYTTLAEKHHWAQRLGAEHRVIAGSRHGTPFDAIHASNTCLCAFLVGQPLPADAELSVDGPQRTPAMAPD